MTDTEATSDVSKRGQITRFRRSWFDPTPVAEATAELVGAR